MGRTEPDVITERGPEEKAGVWFQMRNKRLWGAALLILLCCAGLLLVNRRASAPAPGKPDKRYDVLLVNADHPLPEDFEPGELVNCYEARRHFLLANSSVELERETFEAANRMFRAAEEENMNGFILTSGYRSRERQAELYDESEAGTAQAPGCSEHETGLAFDVTARTTADSFEATPQFDWLIRHCWEYGFILRYPRGKEEITGIAYEPWHYRYVGEKIAALIRQNGWTLEEFCGQYAVLP